MVHAKADRHAQQARGQADQGELQRIAQGDRALALAQHAQHRAVVQVAGREAPRRQCHRHGAEQGGQQGHQVQEFLGAVQRLAHLGAPALQRLDAHAAHLAPLDLFGGPGHELSHPAVVAGHRHAVGDPARGLHQTGGRDVACIDHHPRREVHETGPSVGLVDDQACDAQAGIAQQQRIPHLQVQRVQQRRIDPGLTRRGNLTRGPPRIARLLAHRQLAPQRIAGRHGLEGDELAGAALRVGRPPHGRKTHRLSRAQAERARLFLEHGGRRVVAGHHGVATEQLARIALQPALDPVGKKAHRRQRRHRQRHRDDQQAQVARAQVAPQAAPAQGPDRGSVKGVHGRYLSACGEHPCAAPALGACQSAQPAPDRPKPATSARREGSEARALASVGGGIQAAVRRRGPASSGCSCRRSAPA
jgi:hypothetical protein